MILTFYIDTVWRREIEKFCLLSMKAALVHITNYVSTRVYTAILNPVISVVDTIYKICDQYYQYNVDKSTKIRSSCR